MYGFLKGCVTEKLKVPMEPVRMEFTAKSAMVVMVSWNVDPLADVRFDMGLKIMADVGLNPIFSYIIKLHRLVLSMCYSHCISHCPYVNFAHHSQLNESESEYLKTKYSDFIMVSAMPMCWGTRTCCRAC